MTRTTRTYAILSVPPAIYACIRAKLVSAGYTDALHNGAEGDELIDMHGIALQPEDDDTAYESGWIASRRGGALPTPIEVGRKRLYNTPEEALVALNPSEWVAVHITRTTQVSVTAPK